MTKGLKIAIFGASLVSALWNGSATYYRGLIRALYSRGHRVTFYEPDAFHRQQHRDMANPDWARVVVYPVNDQQAALDAVADASGSDVVIKSSGVGVFDELLDQAVLSLQGPLTLVAFWDVNAPGTLDKITTDPSDPFRALISRYDLILTYGGGEMVSNAYKRLGAEKCVPICNALDPYTHFRCPPDEQFEAEMAFLGNRVPDRELRMEELFLGAAERLPNKKFLLGGSGWIDKPKPRNVHLLGHVYTHQHNAFNSTPKTILSVSRQDNSRYGFSPPSRFFGATGAAACLISDRWDGIELFLEPGKEVFIAESTEDVVDTLRALTPQRARQVGEAAQRRVLAEHTYNHRAEQLEKALAGKD